MPGNAPSLVGSLRQSGRLAQKELREILRDRRTIVTLILMPILIYPLIGVTFQKFLTSQLSGQPRVEYRIGFNTHDSAHQAIGMLRTAQRLTAQAADEGFDPERRPAGTDADPQLKTFVPATAEETYDLEELLRQGEIDIGLIAESDERQSIKLQMITEERAPVGAKARRYLEDQFRLVNDEFYRQMLRRIDSELTPPVLVQTRNIPGVGQAAFSLATLVPLILILMTVTGAVYPAIDLTAGERERGTLEALISAPVPKHKLLFAKYVAVLTVALLTAVANLIAMTVTAYITGLETLLFGRDGLSFWLIMNVFGVLAVFAGFFSSILLAVTSFARSFKEAQAYLIPVMLVSIAPGILALMPELELTLGMSLVPLANVVLLTRDLFDGQLSAMPAGLALVSTLAYTVIGLWLAARIFGTDAVLYGSSGSWSDALQRPTMAGVEPSLTQVLGCLAIVLPTFLFLGRLLSRWVETSLDAWLVGQVCLTTAVFVGLPLACSIWQRIPVRDAFQCHRPSGWSWLAAIIAGLSLWPFAYELLMLLLPSERLQDLVEKFADLKTRLTSIPYGVSLLVFGIAPAVTEELFFRGYLLQGLARGWGRWPAIVLSAVIFGAFHVFVQGLSFERFPPTTLLGLWLGWVCWRTGSVWPGMLLHALHNSFLLSLSHRVEELQAMGIGIEHDKHLPGWLLLIAGGMVCASGLIFQRLHPAKATPATSTGL